MPTSTERRNPKYLFFSETSNQANISHHILKSVNISQYCQSVTKIFNQHRLSAITGEHNWLSLPSLNNLNTILKGCKQQSTPFRNGVSYYIAFKFRDGIIYFIIELFI